MRNVIIAVLLICLFRPAVAQQPGTANDALLLDLYQNQRFAEAAELLKKTYPEPVTDIRVLSKLAYTSQMAGKLPDAEGYYQRMYVIDSANNGVLYNLASINLRRGNNVKAEMFYKILSQKDTTNFLVFKQLSKIYRDKNDLESMVIYLQKANKLNPADADVASDLSDMYVNLKQTDQAEKVLDGAISQDPENIVLLQSLLKLSYAEKNYEVAKNTCLKLIAAGAENGLVLTRLESAYYNLKQYECSIDAFKRIPEISQSETSYYIAALTYKELKDQSQAIENLGKAIEAGISPNISDYYTEMADSYDVRKKYKAAIHAYEKALQFDEKPIIYYLMATMYDGSLKNKKQAVKYYKKFMSTKPTGKQQKYVAYAQARATELSR
ncbi:tetratricopeptide repeat protein [Mucilaginibacter sp. FT3.2]|uniref:tetratricopeptide repeat protein n=1 Tax=Mucilaginibacter sp. FT3.2 TaxID=2723090 RepID=UPI00162081C9|nr:tetratricopeptide repeat protein [Mucilaginibacter sp. FT3.2]MBB6230204.1 tetratricopeptide (TPR) repeat protein [Mucilaginibacter sp. FT3.2]